MKISAIKISPSGRFNLKNGLTVLFYPTKSLLSTFAVVFVRVGAAYDNDAEIGMSHFVEHLSFTGTKKYPSALAIAQAADAVGAKFNGGTGELRTQYHIKMPYLHFEPGIKILSELVFYPFFAKGEIKKEKNVILSEFNDIWHNPERRFNYEVFRQRFKQKEHPYARLVVGNPEKIKQFSESKAILLRKKYYQPANMVLSIAGDLAKNSVLKTAEKYFDYGQKGIETKEKKFDRGDYSDFGYYYQEEKRPQIQFVISFPGFGEKELSRKERIVLSFLAYILGRGRRSRLNLRLREKEGFVYKVGTDYTCYPYLGDFLIWGSVPVDKLLPAFSAVKEEIEKLMAKGIPGDELLLAKNSYAASLLMQFDNPEAIAYYFIVQEFKKEEIWLPQRNIEEDEKITAKEILTLAGKIFDYKKININLLGFVPPELQKRVQSVFAF